MIRISGTVLGDYGEAGVLYLSPKELLIDNVLKEVVDLYNGYSSL